MWWNVLVCHFFAGCLSVDVVNISFVSKNSSINKHISICQNKDYTGIEVKIIVLDPVNLRLFEMFLM